jgi:ABC-type nitrate/sulfonate/bicarbonate transport system substrate-binding protein
MAQMDRRMLLRRTLQYGGGVMMLGPTASFLAACGGDDDGGSADAATTPETTAAGATTPATAAGGDAPADLGALDYRLSWIKNVEFAGAYIADTNGYYAAEGFSTVNLIAGGPSAQPSEVDVSSGAAFVGVSAPDVTASAILAGSDLKIIGAQYQKNPFCVMSLASNPVKTPEEMYGKKFGLQSANQVIWDAFVAASGIDDSQIEKFPAQFDPTPLVNGECDCWFSFITNEPNLLKIEGIETFNFLIADFGYPLVSETMVVKTESITNEREKVKAFLKAEIMGWRDSLADPVLGATLTVEKYGSDLGLTVEEQTLESEAQNELLLTDDTKANGLFTLTPTLLEEQIATLASAGIEVTAEQLFDMSLIEEVYAENPDLKTPPV